MQFFKDAFQKCFDMKKIVIKGKVTFKVLKSRKKRYTKLIKKSGLKNFVVR